MAESLWDAIDAYWLAALTADLQTARLVTDPYRVSSVINTADWQPKVWTFPVAIINGETAMMEAETHYDGLQHSENTYPYILAAIYLADSYAGARKAAKTLASRLMESYLGRVGMGGLANDAGTERVQDTRAFRMDHEVWPPEGNRTHWYGMGRLEINIYSTR